jgi:hypothetical protein
VYCPRSWSRSWSRVSQIRSSVPGWFRVSRSWSRMCRIFQSIPDLELRVSQIWFLARSYLQAHKLPTFHPERNRGSLALAPSVTAHKGGASNNNYPPVVEYRPTSWAPRATVTPPTGHWLSVEDTSCQVCQDILHVNISCNPPRDHYGPSDNFIITSTFVQRLMNKAELLGVCLSSSAFFPMFPVPFLPGPGRYYIWFGCH